MNKIKKYTPHIAIAFVIAIVSIVFYWIYSTNTVEYRKQQYRLAQIKLWKVQLTENKNCMKDIVSEYSKDSMQDFKENIFYGCLGNTKQLRDQLKSYGVEKESSPSPYGGL